MNTTLVLSEGMSRALREITQNHLETGGVLLATALDDPLGGHRLIGVSFFPVPEEAYVSRTDMGLTITPLAVLPALGAAERVGAVAIWVHTHPGVGSIPLESSKDVVVNRDLAETFRIRTGSPFYGYLILAPTEDGVAFSGKLFHENGQEFSVGKIWEVGDRFRMTYAYGTPDKSLSGEHDRSVRALGPAIQAALGDLTVGIVGCGGTGSAVAEQLARLGVKNFRLIDPKRLTDSNVTRVYGSYPSDVNSPKVEIALRNIKLISPNAECNIWQDSITREEIARILGGCDVVFGCTDDNAGRLVLSRIPTFLLVPVFDCGVLLSANEQGVLIGIDGRVTTVLPEGPCLICRDRIDLRRAAADLMNPEERTRLAAEGYAPNLGEVEPAVVTFTTPVASSVINEFLERLVGFGPTPRPTEVLLRFHEREISKNAGSSRDRHYCHPAAGNLGQANRTPFLDITWQS